MWPGREADRLILDPTCPEQSSPRLVQVAAEALLIQNMNVNVEHECAKKLDVVLRSNLVQGSVRLELLFMC